MPRQFQRFVWNRRGAPATKGVGATASAAQTPPTPTPDQAIVQNWVTGLQLLQGVPFNYLVPDAGMLPPESLRFFTLDPNWVVALIDGALSVGKATSNQLWLSGLEQLQNPVVSGFLLRSAAVTSWPGLQITAYPTASQTPLTTLCLTPLAPAVLLGLFAGELAQLVLQEPSEGLHFGVDEIQPTPPTPGQYTKTLRSLGSSNPGTLLSTTATALVRNAGMNVLNIDGLANSIQSQLSPTTFTSAEFGMEMLQGVQLVTFNVEGQ